MTTIKQVADACGVSKPFIAKIVRDLDPEEKQRKKVGNRIELDDQLVSAVAHEAVRRKAGMAARDEAVAAVLEASSDAEEEAAARFEAEARALRERYDDLISEKDARIADLKDQLERLRAERDAENADHRELVERQEAECQRLREYARKLEHAHWWQKRSVINAFGILPEPGD